MEGEKYDAILLAENGEKGAATALKTIQERLKKSEEVSLASIAFLPSSSHPFSSFHSRLLLLQPTLTLSLSPFPAPRFSSHFLPLSALFPLTLARSLQEAIGTSAGTWLEALGGVSEESTHSLLSPRIPSFLVS